MSPLGWCPPGVLSSSSSKPGSSPQLLAQVSCLVPTLPCLGAPALRDGYFPRAPLPQPPLRTAFPHIGPFGPDAAENRVSAQPRGVLSLHPRSLQLGPQHGVTSGTRGGG